MCIYDKKAEMELSRRTEGLIRREGRGNRIGVKMRNTGYILV